MAFVGLDSVLNFEKLRAVGQIAIALGGDDDDVFQAHTADADVVEPGLDRHHVTGAQDRIDRSNARRFMDVQP